MATKPRTPNLGPGLRWRGNTIWMRSTRQGHRFNESTGTSKVAEARAAYAARLAAPPKEPAPAARASHRLTIEMLRDWHMAVVQKRSPGHQNGVDYAWKHGLVPYFAGAEVDRLRPHDLLDYVVSRADDGGVSGNTIQREVQFLRRALRYHNEHLELPVRTPPKPDQAEFDLHVVSASRAGAHIEDVHLKTLYQGVSDACRRWMLMLLATGMRQAELRRVQASWLRRAPLLVPSGGLLSLPAWATKTKRARVLSLPEWAYQAFAAGPLPFTYNSYKVMNAAADRYGLPPDVFAHDRSLRKTFASRAREESGDEVAVDLAMGHKRRGSSGRYQDLTEYRAYAVGRSITVRYRALLTSLGLPHEVWPTPARWEAEAARRRKTQECALLPNTSNM